MPLYEYRCDACGSRFDRLTSAPNADRASCQDCGSTHVRRLLSVIAGVGGRAAPEPPVCGGGACAACS